MIKENSVVVLKNAWICQVINHSIVPVFGDLVIKDQRIGEIRGKKFSAYITDSMPAKDDGLDVAGRLVTLPLINFHEHFYARLARGLPIQGPTDRFDQILENLWWKLDLLLDLDLVTACAQMGALESIRNGVTYIFDHHASPAAASGSLSAIARVLQAFGLRGVLCFETSDRHNHQLAEQALAENVRFHTENLPEIKAMLGLHASFTLSDTSLDDAADIISRHNLGIHIHLCEDRVDRDETQIRYNKLPTQRLADFNLLNPRSILAHGAHLKQDDYRIIAKSGSAIAYNLCSNLNNAVGLPKFGRVPSSIPILIGTDGMHANVARSMKQLFLLYRHQGHSFARAFNWIEKVYFDQLKFVRQYFPDFPTLQKGDRADFIVRDYVPPTPITAENFWGHFIYGALEQPVHSVLQNGKLLMKNYQIQNLTVDETMKSIFPQGEKLFSKFQVDD